MIQNIDVKEMLAEALIEIAKHKPVDKITVTDIVTECKTSRRTFYNHFVDKYELISWIYTNREERILSCFEATDSWEQCMIHTYRVFLENADYFAVVIDQEGQNSFYQTFVAHTYDYMRSIILKKLGTPHIPEALDYALTVHVFGQVNCVLKWLHEGAVISPGQWPSIMWKICRRRYGGSFLRRFSRISTLPRRLSRFLPALIRYLSVSWLY